MAWGSHRVSGGLGVLPTPDCERHDVGYILGLARNPVLEREAAVACEVARDGFEATGTKSRSFEVLIRTLYSPYQINENGMVTPASFRDALKRGLSINRKSCIDEADLPRRIEGKIERDRKAGKERDEFYRVVTARCGDVRQLFSEEGERLFCIYDTASEEDVSHADVCQALDPPPGTPNCKMLRMKTLSRLFDVFVGEATDLATVYSGDG